MQSINSQWLFLLLQNSYGYPPSQVPMHSAYSNLLCKKKNTDFSTKSLCTLSLPLLPTFIIIIINTYQMYADLLRDVLCGQAELDLCNCPCPNLNFSLHKKWDFQCRREEACAMLATSSRCFCSVGSPGSTRQDQCSCRTTYPFLGGYVGSLH